MECERIADELSGLSRKRWCRRRNWAPPPAFDSGWNNETFVDRHSSQELSSSTLGLSSGSTSGATETWAEGMYADDVPTQGPKKGGQTSDTFVLSVDVTEEEMAANSAAQSGHVAVSDNDTLGHRLDTEAAGPQKLPMWAYASPIVLLLLLGGAVGAYLAGSGGQRDGSPQTDDASTVEVEASDTLEATVIEQPDAPVEPPVEPVDGAAAANATQTDSPEGTSDGSEGDRAVDTTPKETEPVTGPPPVTPPTTPPSPPVETQSVETPNPEASGPDEEGSTEDAEALPTPEPAPVKYGEVNSDGKAKVRLVGDAGAIDIGRVPVGRYTVEADFGTGWAPQGRVDVFEGQTKSVRCNVMTFGCEVD
jgi:hypothetical protein